MVVEIQGDMSVRGQLKVALQESRRRAEPFFRTPNLRWNTYNSPVDNYNQSFWQALGGGLVEFLADRDHLVVLDLMSSPSALRDLSQKLKGATMRGISVSLEDHRPEGLVSKDENSGLTHIVGDLTYRHTWTLIEEALAGEQADLILERAVAGLDIFPRHPVFMLSCTRRLWRMLRNEGGTLLAQVPSNDFKHKPFLFKHLDEWVKWLQEQGIDASIHPDIVNFYRILKITRHPSNPPKFPVPLPTLPA